MIRFPTMHIATSVTNRILNLADGIEADALSRRRIAAPPVTGDTMAQSKALDAALSAPPGGAIPISQAPDPGQTVAGKPMLATKLDPK